MIINYKNLQFKQFIFLLKFKQFIDDLVIEI